MRGNISIIKEKKPYYKYNDRTREKVNNRIESEVKPPIGRHSPDSRHIAILTRFYILSLPHSKTNVNKHC